MSLSPKKVNVAVSILGVKSHNTKLQLLRYSTDLSMAPVCHKKVRNGLAKKNIKVLREYVTVSQPPGLWLSPDCLINTPTNPPPVGRHGTQVKYPECTSATAPSAPPPLILLPQILFFPEITCHW